MRVRRVDGEAPIGHVTTVQIGRRRRDADVGIRRLTAKGRGRIGDDHLLGRWLRLRPGRTGPRLLSRIDALRSTQLVGISFIVRYAAGPQPVAVLPGKL